MNLHLNEAIIAKMTIKKVMSQIDHVETLLAYGGMPQVSARGAEYAQQGGLAPDIKMILADWFAEMRVHLRRIEHMAEHSVR